MPQSFQLLLFGGVAVLIALAAYGAYVQHERRPHMLAAAAVQLGWEFDLREVRPTVLLEGPFQAFQKGHRRSTYNRLMGALEVHGQSWPAVAGDYQYYTESSNNNGKGSSQQKHRFSYLVVETPHLGTPDLAIRREGIFDRFAGFMGFDDIDFESHEFSERFHVKSSDKRFAYAVIDARMIEFLLESTPPAFEFRRGQCCFLQGSQVWTGDEFVNVIRWAEQFFNAWPARLPSILDA